MFVHSSFNLLSNLFFLIKKIELNAFKTECFMISEKEKKMKVLRYLEVKIFKKRVLQRTVLKTKNEIVRCMYGFTFKVH